jgi:peptidoglycan hydrolase FlgJ
MIPPLGPSAQPPPKASSDSPEALRDAAAKFEGLLLGQLLKSARESGSAGGSGDSGDSTAGSMFELAEGHLAEVLAARGGLGLANMIVQQLQPKDPP